MMIMGAKLDSDSGKGQLLHEREAVRGRVESEKAVVNASEARCGVLLSGDEMSRPRCTD